MSTLILEKRFPDLPVIKAFQVFNPQDLPSEKDHLDGYGEDCIKELSQHYCVDTCAVLQEWESLRLVMHQERYGTSAVSNKDTTDVLQVLSDSFSTLYPLLSSLPRLHLPFQ